MPHFSPASSEVAAPAGLVQLADLPSPRGLPLLGNMLQMDLPRLHLVLEAWGRELGSLYAIRLGSQRVFVSTDPELLQKVLRERPERYRRYSPVESVLVEMQANGVFSVEGEAWRPQRKLVMQALASTNFRAYFPVLKAITERLHRKWERAASTGEVVDMCGELMRFTVDATTALAFGEDPNTIDETGNVIQEHLGAIFPMIWKRINAPVPLWRYLKLPGDHKFDKSMAVVLAHVHALIEHARRHLRDVPSGGPRNLLEAMLVAADTPGSDITDEIIVANVLTLLVAGEDTTAHTLAWCMYFLSANVALQASLHAQSVDALGEAVVCPAFEDLRKLDVFEAVAHEASRFKPVVSLLFMEPVVDVVLGNVALPAGTPLFFVLRPAMLDSSHFERADEFLPQRWATGHDQVQTHDPRAYAQFGAGPRMCPGRHLAGVEIRLVLSMLSRNFSVELATDRAAIREVANFTMMPSAMPVRLKPLSRRSG
jgi:cytochrome P450